MNLKRLALAAAAGTSLLAAAPAFADPPHWAPAHGWRATHHHHYRSQPVVVYAPAPVYYYPPPRPVIYGYIPVNPDLRVRFGVRL
jgi:hypothetical protein